MNFLRRNKFIALLLLMFVIGTIGFYVYTVLYDMKMASYQSVYEEMWVDARPGAQSLADGGVVEKMEDIRQPVETYEDAEKWQQFLGIEVQKPDFEVLKSYNPDVIAYIVIPDTPIAYPIMRSEDNTYYLNHNMDGTTGYPGCLYVENYNSAQLEEPLVIVYGHNMRNDTMFGTLNEYADKAYREAHPYIVIYLPDEVRVYEVVLASKYEDEHLLSHDFVLGQNGEYVFHDFSDGESTKFLSSVKKYGAKGAFIDSDKVTDEDRMIVLSTCVDFNKRYLIGAKEILIEEE